MKPESRCDCRLHMVSFVLWWRLNLPWVGQGNTGWYAYLSRPPVHEIISKFQFENPVHHLQLQFQRAIYLCVVCGNGFHDCAIMSGWVAAVMQCKFSYFLALWLWNANWKVGLVSPSCPVVLTLCWTVSVRLETRLSLMRKLIELLHV